MLKCQSLSQSTVYLLTALEGGMSYCVEFIQRFGESAPKDASDLTIMRRSCFQGS